mgnify:CR=1 FL=1
MSGSVILLNGASSSGKSTIAHAAQSVLSKPFWHYSIDHLLEARVLPQVRIDSGEFPWSGLRPSFFEGFHRSIPALAQAGNNLLVEHIIETNEWMDRLLDLLAEHDVFFVGVHCPLAELECRELERGNRRIGEARADFAVAHMHCEYDLELDGTKPRELLGQELAAAWQGRGAHGALSRMVARRRAGGAA